MSDQMRADLEVVLSKRHGQPLRCFNSSPEFIRLVVMIYVRYPLSLRDVEDLLAERGIDVSTRQSGSGGTGLADVRRRDPQRARRALARLHPVALAFG
jgi:putative transposase